MYQLRLLLKVWLLHLLIYARGCGHDEKVLGNIPSSIDKTRINRSAKDFIAIAEGIARTEWVKVCVSSFVGVSTFDIFVCRQI